MIFSLVRNKIPDVVLATIFLQHSVGEMRGCFRSLCCEGINVEISTPPNLSGIFSEHVEEAVKEGV